VNAFEKAASRREERREQKSRDELLRSASRFSSSAQISEEELQGIRRWEGAEAAAAALAASKERGRYTPVTKTPPQTAPAAADSTAATAAPGANNIFSTLSLVFAILGGVLGIVFGVIALSQIRRTGEGGEGNARSGIILGSIFVAVFIVYLIVSPLI
jgi:hypothetical protein